MKRRLGISLTLTLALIATPVLGACQKKESADANGTAVEVSESEPQEQAAEVETSEYEGTLFSAYQGKLVIAGEEGDLELVTGADTVYDTADLGEMYLDDIVSVTYHADEKGNHADKVTLVEHFETPLAFEGELVDSDDDSLTLANESLSATFQIDADSYIVGDLSRGDKVELTYLGNLSENPYADVVAVVNEAEPPETHVVHGLVSELAGRTVLVGIDSAHAYRFTITDGTQISGAASHISIGDQIDLTYKGRISEQPDALSIKVVKSALWSTFVINGTVTAVEKGSVTLDSGMATYTFVTNANTKYCGENPTKGYRAEITYTGELGKNPEVVIIYCAKSAQEAGKAAAEEKKGKKDSGAKVDDNTGKTDTNDLQDADDKTTENEGRTGQPLPSAEEESGTAKTLTDDLENEADVVEPTPEQKEQQKTEAAETAQEPEQKPQADAVVEQQEPAAEEKPAAEPEAEVEAEPEPEPEPEPQVEAEPEPEPEAEPEPQVETEPEPEPAEPVVESEPEAEPESEPEAEPQVEAGPVASPLVNGQGTIVKGNEKDKTIEIALKNGETITLKYDKDTKVPSGYLPQKDDVIEIEYDSTNQMLKSIKLVDRKAEAEVVPEQNEGDTNTSEAPENTEEEQG